MQKQNSESTENTAQNLHLPTALLVEESDIWGNVLYRYLTARGLDVTWFKTAAGSMSFILDVDPDLIVVEDTIHDSGAALIDEIGRLGPETKARMLILTGETSPTARHSTGSPVIRKSDLFGIGTWIDQRTGMFPPLMIDRNRDNS